METDRMLSYVDHTLLDPCATWDRIRVLCEEAIEYHTASVCVPPTFVKRIRETYGDAITICTVVGFPLGYHDVRIKCAEAALAITDGCDEIDMVINLGTVKEGDFASIEEEIRALKAVCRDHILKVIIETCYLSQEEKIALCRAVTKGGADYIKTSTGFGTAGATAEDVKLFREYIGSDVKIKAAGGVASMDDLASFIALGCDRIGTSKAVKLIMNETVQKQI